MNAVSPSVPADAAPAASADAVSQPVRWPLLLFLAALWAWAIAGCADEWTHNPMYSYGWFVPFLMLFFAWRRIDETPGGVAAYEAGRPPRNARLLTVVFAVAAVLVLPLEWFRQEVPDDRFNNWVVALAAVGFTLLVAGWFGGRALRWSLLFPVIFFLAAVPWPKRWEWPLTLGLQGFVAAVIMELLHLLGIHAVQQGTTIHLRNGPVGIAEACSGIRSLQASLMISLAIGELFFLGWVRRLLLIVLAAVVAIIMNLGRTLALCLLAEYEGQAGMDRWHDTIGNVILLGLPLVVWSIGWLLSRWDEPDPVRPNRPAAGAVVRQFFAHLRGAPWARLPSLAPALVVGVAGFLTYHTWLLVLDFRDPPQREPFFVMRAGPEQGVAELPVEKAIREVLNFTSGGYLQHTNSAVLDGSVFCYYFFWKPDAANRWATGHRPDVCMPAGGWKPAGEPFPVTVELDGHPLTFTAFHFSDGDRQALQLWGQWRNGESMNVDFFGGTLSWDLFKGRSRSAVETVSCVVHFKDGEPLPLEIARQTLETLFGYQRPVRSRETKLAGEAAP